MVVLAGELYYVDSADAGVSLEAVPFITFRRELKGEHVSGRFALEFVRQAEIGRFLAERLEPITKHVAALVAEKPDLVLTREVPWKD